MLETTSFNTPRGERHVFVMNFGGSCFSGVRGFSRLFDFPGPARDGAHIKSVLRSIPTSSAICAVSSGL